MKVRLSELRKFIQEELGLTEAVSNQSLQRGVTSLVMAFPSAVNNEIMTQKMGLTNADNRMKQNALDLTSEHTKAATQKFQQELEALIEKHFVEAVNSFKAPQGQQLQQPQARPSTGPNPDQRATVMPPAMT